MNRYQHVDKYSSYLENGEGEHKIIRDIRNTYNIERDRSQQYLTPPQQ